MIDGTEKPKILSNFAKRTARYNEVAVKNAHSVKQCVMQTSTCQNLSFPFERIIVINVHVGKIDPSFVIPHGVNSVPTHVLSPYN